MGMPVRIDNLLYEQAKNEAKAEHRTIAGQLGYTIGEELKLVDLEAVGAHENFYRDWK